MQANKYKPSSTNGLGTNDGLNLEQAKIVPVDFYFTLALGLNLAQLMG